MGDELEDDPDSFRTLESLDQTLTCLSVRMQQSTTIFAAVAAIHGEPRPSPPCIHNLILVLACAYPCVRVSAHVSLIVYMRVSLIASFSYLYASQRSWVQCALLSS